MKPDRVPDKKTRELEVPDIVASTRPKEGSGLTTQEGGRTTSQRGECGTNKLTKVINFGKKLGGIKKADAILERSGISGRLQKESLTVDHDDEKEYGGQGDTLCC